MSIIIKNIKKSFGKFVAIDDVSFEIKEGEFVAILGPSGSGKTTLLRIIAGLEWTDNGEIYLEGKDARGKPIMERKVGFVFQHFALFKHMTVFENIAFGLRLKRPKLSKIEIEKRVGELLNLIHMENMEDKYPSMLSGGQRQRIALARVLAIEPKYMLLDEPFGALDAKVRKDLRRWLKKLHDSTGLTTIFVTHDQEEAMEIADKLVILNEGKLVEIGTPLDLWNHPKNAFVFDFLGSYNTFFGYETQEGKLILETHRASPFVKIKKFFSKSHETIIEKELQDSRYYLRTKLILINQTGPYIKTELEDASGKVYQVDIDRPCFERLQLAIGQYLWIRPARYISFN